MADWMMLALTVVLVTYWIGAIVFIVLENRPPTTALAWLLVLVLLPYVGLPLYVFFGRNWPATVKRTGWYRDLLVYVPKALDPYFTAFPGSETRVATANREVPVVEHVVKVIDRMEGAKPLPVRTVDVFDTGREHFSHLMEDIRRAQRFVHLSTYIWEQDALTAEMTEILLERLGSGVEVRINYDWLGSLAHGKRELRVLKAAGARVAADFMEVTKINYRNHRKITVIDGEIGYTGGMNIGQEYVDGGGRFETWRDTHVRITGPGVAQLQAWFATRWYADTRELLLAPRYLPDLDAAPGSIFVQTAANGPDNTWGSARRAHLEAISGADRQVLIQSPYFVPDEPTYDALINAALSGIDLQLMMTGVPDKRLAYWAAQSYWGPFVKAGGRLFLYEKGFFHPKTLVLDGRACAIGTMNMDVRSFRLNQEIMLWIYDETVTQQCARMFARDVEDCREITIAEADALTIPERFVSSGARLISNIL